MLVLLGKKIKVWQVLGQGQGKRSFLSIWKGSSLSPKCRWAGHTQRSRDNRNWHCVLHCLAVCRLWTQLAFSDNSILPAWPVRKWPHRSTCPWHVPGYAHLFTLCRTCWPCLGLWEAACRFCENLVSLTGIYIKNLNARAKTIKLLEMGSLSLLLLEKKNPLVSVTTVI